MKLRTRIVDHEEYYEVWPCTLYFDQNSDGTQTTEWQLMQDMVTWCREHLDPDSWTYDGITKYSYKFFLKNPEDIVVLKLTFPGLGVNVFEVYDDGDDDGD